MTLACRCGNVWTPFKHRGHTLRACPICKRHGDEVSLTLLHWVEAQKRKDNAEIGGPCNPHGSAYGYEYACNTGGKVRRVNISLQ